MSGVVLSGIIAAGVLVSVVLVVLFVRRGNVSAYKRYHEYGKSFLNHRLSLEPVPVPEQYRLLKPSKAFGMFVCIGDTRKGDRFRWINMSDSTIAVFMKMHTILFIPESTYNLPMLSIDIIFMGKKRVFAVEFIDPAGIEDPHLTKHYEALRTLKPSDDILNEKPVTYWYKDIVTDFSIHSTLTSDEDDIIFNTYRSYLDAYIDMVREAEPVSAETQEIIRQKQIWYVQTLLEQGGPAVNLLEKMMGREKQREYVWTVMFGFDKRYS